MLFRNTIICMLGLQIANGANPVTPKTLKSISLSSISNGYEDNFSYEISKKICPQMFNDNITPEYSGFNHIFFAETLLKEELDCTEMNLSRIPMIFTGRLKKLKKLNLSKNPQIELHGEWFQQISKHLKEINLNSCNLQQNDFEVLAGIKYLEALSISRNKKLDFTSPHFISILKKLKYLDISFCGLDFNTLEMILKHATKLECLDFSGNNLINLFEKIHILNYFESNLKGLGISDCKLKANDLKCISIFKKLETINLSNNNFSHINTEFIQELFEPNMDNKSEERCPSRKRKRQESLDSLNDEDDLSNGFSQLKAVEKKNSNDYSSTLKLTCLKNLKIINLTNCEIRSYDFISKIFDLEGLEALDLSLNKLIFDFDKIVSGKAKNSLKILKLFNCFIHGDQNLHYLTNFDKLETLDISQNNFSTILEGFELGCSKETLKILNISDNELNIHGLRAVSDCQNLEFLDISCNNLINLPREFSLGLSKNSLKILNIRNSKLNCHGLKAITDCLKLEKLEASANYFGYLPNGFILGASKNSLKSIKISKCHLNYFGLKKLTECSKLKILDASFNDFKDIPEGYTLNCSKNSLEELNLTQCDLNLHGLKAITDCNNLKNLTVTRNLFGGMTKDFKFGSSKNSLINININDCNLNYYGLQVLTDCPKVKQLDASFNKFKDIPSKFKFKWSKNSLEILNLIQSELNINGLIAISECTKLRNLKVSGNGFEKLKIDQKNIHNSLKSYLD